jgi:hypothetical protein
LRADAAEHRSSAYDQRETKEIMMDANSLDSGTALTRVIGPKRAAQSVLAALNAGKISEALDQFKGQFEYIDYAPGLEFVDKLRLTEFFQKSRELFPDTVVQVNVTFECEDHALVEWTLTSNSDHRPLPYQVSVFATRRVYRAC